MYFFLLPPQHHFKSLESNQNPKPGKAPSERHHGSRSYCHPGAVVQFKEAGEISAQFCGV
jgi:hypothetical protein